MLGLCAPPSGMWQPLHTCSPVRTRTPKAPAGHGRLDAVWEGLWLWWISHNGAETLSQNQKCLRARGTPLVETTLKRNEEEAGGKRGG